MAPRFSKWTSKIKEKLFGSDSEDETASNQPSTAQSTTPAHATSSSVATPTTSTTTTTTDMIAQPEATSTPQPTGSSTGQPLVSSAEPSTSPQSTQPTATSTPQPTTSSTTQPAASSRDQPAVSTATEFPASPAPQPAASPPIQSTTSPPPPTTATSSEQQSLPEKLWKKAYKGLEEKEPDRVQAYEEILSKLQKEWAGTATSPTIPDLEHCKSAKSAEMWKVVYAGLEKSKKQAESKEAVADVLGTVDKIKGIVDKAVKYSPEASTIWAGASLGLEILANPVTEPGINRKGIAYVLSRIEWYWNLADVVLSEDMASTSSDNLRKNLESHVVDLYKKLLLFQMRCVCLYDRNGISVFLRDAIKLDDWTDQIKEVKDAETLAQKDLDQFTGQDMRAKLQEIRDTAWTQEQLFRQEVRRLQKRDQDKDDQKCLVDLLLTDPQEDKKRIQIMRGNPLWDSYHWILEHPRYGEFTNDPSSKVLWIKGSPGKGKTMLLCGIIDQLNRLTNPLSYFFCQATEKDQSSDTAAMRGLIYMILDHYPLLMPKLRVEYDKKGKKLFDSPNTSLLLAGVLTDMLQDPILEDAVFIIDALDECKIGRSTLVKLIVKLSSSCRARWIVSSRDWPEIKQEFRGIRGLVSIILEENKDEVAQAVQSYIRTKVDDLAKSWADDDEDEDDDDDIDDNDDKDSTEDLKKTVYDYMVSHAEDTFLWVALVCKRLAESDVPKRRVTEELEMFPKGLPDLYELMMDRILKYSPLESRRLKAVLAAACLAHGHLKSKDMIGFVQSMAKYNNKDVKGTIGACGSFLTYQSGVVYFVHQSAKEYLLNEGKGHVFPNGVEQQHLQMALRCLEILQGGLKGENIYGLSSYGTLIGEFTRPSPDPLSPLEYSCLHWADHLVKSGACGKDEVVSKTFRFLRDKFTYWLEALSLLGQLSVAVKAIDGIESTLGVVGANDLLEFLRDARRFVRYHKVGIEIAPRQVYASALVFSPRWSTVRRNFEKQIPEWIVSEPKMQDSWGNRIETISTASQWVSNVACSPDGLLFAAACGVEAKVYDAVSGECIYTLRYQNDLGGVAFSPCGSMLAVAGRMGVEILRTATFACIKTIGDSDVYSVIFSPDGEQLATQGYTVARIWNWKTGSQVHELIGHSQCILSATFLGKSRLVTGSFDRTVKIWDLATGSCERTLEDHGSEICSVASSPDGKRFATGSINRTVKIWEREVDTGEWACSQTLHHEHNVRAISFSVDGHILITGSNEGNIRFWDEAGVCIRTINFNGTGVYSLSVDPTGQQLLASSLGDGNIRLWDISTLDSSAESPQEAQLSPELDDSYIDRINNLVFSPDGKTLVSHAGDGETKIWNVETGSCVLAQEPSNSHKPFLDAPTIASAWTACPTGGERAVTRGQKGETAVWDLVESKRLGPPGEWTRRSPYPFSFGDGVLIYSPDTKFYAVSTNGEPVSVYYAPTGEPVYTSRSERDTALAFSPDSRELFSYELAYGDATSYRYRLDDEILHRLGLGQAETSTDGFLLDTQFGTMEANGHSNHVKLVGWGLSFERDWILRGSERMLYIPIEHRKLIMDTKRNRFAIICPSGRIAMLEVA